MNFRLWRRVLLALKQHFSTKTRNSITSKWLRSARLLMDDAESMSPAPLKPKGEPNEER